MKLKLKSIILILVIYIPFESLLLKYMPVSDLTYSYLRFLAETVIYIVFVIIFLKKILIKKNPAGTPLDVLFLAFVFLSALSIFINGAPLAAGIVGLRNILRYVFLFYIIINLEVDERYTKKIVTLILAGVFVQALLAFEQHYFGISPVFYPRASDLVIAGKSTGFKLLNTGYHGGREIGAGIGTFGDTVPLAIFLGIGFCIICSKVFREKFSWNKGSLSMYLLWVITLVAIFFTYSRISAILALITIIVTAYYYHRTALAIKGVIVFVVLVSLSLLYSAVNPPAATSGTYVNPRFKKTSPVENITELFETNYVETSTQSSRGWIYVGAGGKLLESMNLIGYSPAEDFALSKFMSKDLRFQANQMISDNYHILNDVYWIGLAIYYGIIGVGILFLLLYKTFMMAKHVKKYGKYESIQILALAVMVLIIITIPYNFVIRAMAYRAFGFYFWLLCGLVVNHYILLRKEHKMQIAIQNKNPRL